MIGLRDVFFRYPEGEFALSLPRLDVSRGEQVGVIGPSGSGKSTLLHLVAGIVAPEAGRVEVDGIDLTALGESARRDFRIRRLGLVFQEFALLDHLDVVDNVLLPYRISPALNLDAAVRRRADELLERVGIGRHARRLVTQLSQGERQRVAVCRALATEPALLLADEPTGNLDPQSKFRVLDILREYASEREATLLTVTHDHDLLDRFTRVIDFRRFGPGAAREAGTRTSGGRVPPR